MDTLTERIYERTKDNARQIEQAAVIVCINCMGELGPGEPTVLDGTGYCPDCTMAALVPMAFIGEFTYAELRETGDEFLGLYDDEECIDEW